MDSDSIRRVLTWIGFGVIGFVGTAVLGMTIPSIATPLQLAVYDLVYLHVGPWTAGETASVVVISFAGALGIIGSTLIVLFWTRGVTGLDRRVAAPIVGVIGLLSLEIGAIVLGGEPLLVAVLAVAIFVTLGLIITHRIGAPSAVATWVGGLPAMVILLLLLGFGLGWGGGYQFVAVPVESGSATADFSEVPQVAADVFDEQDGCFTDGAYCVELRDYEHAVTAAQFMDRYGVRCSSPVEASESESFLATYEGQTYRVRCIGYGD